MLTHILYRLKNRAAVTEYGGSGVVGIADVFALGDNDQTHEFEVKVDAGDLAGEIEAIKYLVARASQPTLSDTVLPTRQLSKTSKHNIYLGEENEVYRMIQRRPNKFSFVVPPSLEDKALSGLTGTPYGLYVVEEVSYRQFGSLQASAPHLYYEPVCKRKAKRIHKDVAKNEVINNIVRKACTEVEILRRKLADGRVCTQCPTVLSKRCPKCEEKIKKSRSYTKNSNACWAEVASLPPNEQGVAFNKCMEGKV